MQQDFADPSWRHPYDDEGDEELAEILRETRKNMLSLLSVVADYIDESPKTWGMCFAIGTTNCAGRSMSEIAAKLGCTRATISHHANEFCRIAKIPPSPYMRADKSRA